jgi:hypothetical protein
MKHKFLTSLIERTARELDMDVCYSPFFEADGIELQKRIGNTDTLICIGCICGPKETEIYRRIESKRDVFARTKLWFLWRWLIMPRLHDNRYKTLRIVPSPEFDDQLFIDVVRKELSNTNDE